MSSDRWVDCPNPTCDAHVAVPTHVWRVVGYCPQCAEKWSVILEPLEKQ